MLPILLSLACAAPAPGDVRHAPASSTPGSTSTDPEPTIDTAAVLTDTDAVLTDTGGPCPVGMAYIPAATPYCVDRWEAYLVDASPYEVPSGGVAASAAGVQPQGYISGVVAQLACSNAGKRLCSLDEWTRACAGPDDRLYPYGDTFDPDACNTSRAEHPMVSLFGDAVDWSFEQMNDPGLNQQDDTVDDAGANPGCVSAEGVYDLHGNLHEWVDDPNGTFKGGFYMDASLNGPGCTYTTTAHSFDYHDYSTGFRCCADPR